MKRLLPLVLFVLIFCLAPCAGNAQKVVVGIAPVFDGGGEEFGPVVAQHLTLFSYQELLKTATIYPALLSPGGVYSPLDTSWLTDYVHDRSEISLLLVATLKPVQNPEKSRFVIPVEVQLLNAQSGDTLATWTVSDQIDYHKSLLEYTQYVQATPLRDRYNHYGDMTKKYNITPSRDFEKQPLGKASARLADQIRQTLEAKLNELGKAKSVVPASTTPAVAASGTACPVKMRITYGYKHSASHTYMLLANGLDQSINLTDGISNFQAPEGELLLQFSVNDAPYKLQKESLYQFSTPHSCKYSSLTMDLGQGGDAHAHWE